MKSLWWLLKPYNIKSLLTKREGCFQYPYRKFYICLRKLKPVCSCMTLLTEGNNFTIHSLFLSRHTFIWNVLYFCVTHLWKTIRVITKVTVQKEVRRMVRLKWGVLFVSPKHCLEGIPGDYLVLCPEVGWLGPAGIACVWCSLSSPRFSAVPSGHPSQTPVLSTVRFLSAQPLSALCITEVHQPQVHQPLLPTLSRLWRCCGCPLCHCPVRHERVKEDPSIDSLH